MGDALFVRGLQGLRDLPGVVQRGFEGLRNGSVEPVTSSITRAFSSKP